MIIRPLIFFETSGPFYMQSWLNWYSTGLEIRHSERISEFESLALRSTCYLSVKTINQKEGQNSMKYEKHESSYSMKLR